jgi:hypothetical protein
MVPAAHYIPGDIYDMASRVREIDPALSISFNYNTQKYHINRNKHNVMQVSLNQLDGRIIIALRKGDLSRRRLEDIIRDMEQSEDELEQRKAKHFRDEMEAITYDQYDKLAERHHHRLRPI